jgi:cysteinyl-tRNA synthetase
LNISAALAVVFETVRETNRQMNEGSLSAESAKALLDWLRGVNSVLALDPEEEKIPVEVGGLVERRANARAAKDWKLSDALRDEILAMGWMVKDTKDGQKLTPAPRSETAAH